MVSASFPAISFKHLDAGELPDVCRVRLVHPRGNPIGDVEAAARSAVRSSPRLQALKSGSQVAVALGSRGIAKIPVIAKAIIDALKDMGHVPFIVPAMG